MEARKDGAWQPAKETGMNVYLLSSAFAYLLVVPLPAIGQNIIASHAEMPTANSIPIPAAKIGISPPNDGPTSANLDAAISRAEVVIAQDYFGDARGQVQIMPSVIDTPGVDVSQPLALQGAGEQQTVVRLFGRANRSAVKIMPQRFGTWAKALNSYASLLHLSISGNGANQDSLSNGIEYPATEWNLADEYGMAGKLTDITISNVKSDAIFIGRNRNSAVFNGITIRWSGGNGISVNSFDNIMNNLIVGSNKSNGIQLSQGGGNFFTTTSAFFNDKNGYVISPYNYISNSWIGGTFDANGRNGAYIDEGSRPQVSHQIIGARFTGNSRLDRGASSDVNIVNAPTPAVLMGNVHLFNNKNRPKYLVQLGSSSDFTYGIGLAYSMSSPPWGTAFSNYPQNIILAGNQQARLVHPTGTVDSLAIYMGADETARFERDKTTISRLRVDTFSTSVRIVTSAAPITTSEGESVIIVKKAAHSPTEVRLTTPKMTGQQIIIKDGKGDAATYAITIAPLAGTIDGSASYAIKSAYGVARLIWNGIDWNLL